MFNNIIQLCNNQLTFVISYQIFRYKSFTEWFWFMYKLNIYAMCLCMVDSETWLRNVRLQMCYSLYTVGSVHWRLLWINIKFWSFTLSLNSNMHDYNAWKFDFVILLRGIHTILLIVCKSHHHHSFNVSVPLKVGRTAPMFVLSSFLHSILFAGSALDSFQCLRSLLIVSFHVFFGLPRPRCPTTSNSVMLLIQPSLLTTCPNQRSRLYLKMVFHIFLPGLLAVATNICHWVVFLCWVVTLNLVLSCFSIWSRSVMFPFS